MSWQDTPLTRRLGLDHPILLAPMAGGPTTPELVAAVSQAGGLGTLAFGYQSLESCRKAMARVRELTARPFGVNLLLARDTAVAAAVVARSQALLAPMREELALAQPTVGGPVADDWAAQAELAIELGASSLSFAFGQLPPATIQRLQRAGVAVFGTATSVREALALAADGVDGVIAQGSEAGGHRGSFLEPFALIGTLALVPQVVDAVKVPVVAAGGIMDGRGVAAALALGASGVQLGTAFLLTPESGTSAAFRAQLASATEESTLLTTTFTGKPVRAIANRFTHALTPHAAELAPYPLQHALTRELRHMAAQKGDAGLMGMWAGQGTRLVRAMGAAALVMTLVRETEEALARLDRPKP